ncbi:MAG: hypothetical protein AAGF92_17050 [Myxococcota bacterium]
MYRHEEIQHIIEKAKNQRAEYIGAALKPAVLPIALVATLALVAAQFSGSDSEESARLETTVAVSHVVA